MKKIINILSWASFGIICACVIIGSMYSGALVCNYLHDHVPFFQGTWTCLCLAPILLVTAFSVECFIILGLKKFQS